MSVNYNTWFGMRQVSAFAQLPTIGNHFFVGSATPAAAASGGYFPSAPALTLVQAQTLAAADVYAGSGATIWAAPGHAETITGAAGMTFSVAGVTYRGIGNGRLRPTITFSTATTAQMIITGQGTIFENFVFDFTGIDAIVAAIALKAADIQFINCEFICNNATIGVVRGIYANTSGSPADRLIINNCKFTGAQTNSGTTTTAQLDIEYGANVQILNSTFSGKCTQNILNATACLDWFISNNYFHTYTGTKSIALNSATVAAGFSNRMIVASGTSPVVATGASWAGNIYDTEALTIGTPTASAF